MKAHTFTYILSLRKWSGYARLIYAYIHTDIPPLAHSLTHTRTQHSPVHTIHLPPPPTTSLTLRNVLVPAHGEVVDAANVGPVEARWKVLHVDVLVGQWLRDALALRESSCVNRTYGKRSIRELGGF